MKSRITTKKFLDWNIGKGQQFENLNELLKELEAIKNAFGSSVGYAGGTITEEISQVKGMIKAQAEKK